MSWESSVEYERVMNEAVRERLGGTHSADLVVRSYDFAAIEALQESGGWDALAERLSGDARALEVRSASIQTQPVWRSTSSPPRGRTMTMHECRNRRSRKPPPFV